MWTIMIDMGFPHHIVKLIESLYSKQEAAVRLEGDISGWFRAEQGVRQGCILSPYLFNIYAENIMRQLYYDSSFEAYDSLSIGGHSIPELRYADDTVLLSTSPEGLERLIKSIKEHSESQNLHLNANKTKIMKTDKTHRDPDIKIGNNEIEIVKEFNYLGSMLYNNGDIRREIKRRCSMALNRLKQLKNLWQGTTKSTRVKILRTCIFPIATYGCEAWPISPSLEAMITSFELKCYRKMLKIPWILKRTNQSILEELNIEKNWLITSVKRRKWTFFGHLKRHMSLERTILEGRMPNMRGRGRPRRRWSDDIQENLHTNLTKAGKMAQDRDLYKMAVMKATSRKGHAT